MESAYVLMLSTFGLAIACGVLIPWIQLATALPLCLAIAIVAPALDSSKTRLFVGPFLLAGLFVYGCISHAGARLGRWLRNLVIARVKAKAPLDTL